MGAVLGLWQRNGAGNLRMRGGSWRCWILRSRRKVSVLGLRVLVSQLRMLWIH